MTSVPFNDYLLVYPSGQCEGYTDITAAKARINIYYMNVVKDGVSDHLLYDISEEPVEAIKDICISAGVDYGECKVYRLESFLEALRNQLVFDEEKEELISKLLGEKIDFNIFDYGVDNILRDAEEISVIEPYGEI